MGSENGFLSLLANIVFPMLILNKLSGRLGPQNAVILAFLFPFLYGAYHLWKNKKVSPISVLGLLNVVVTGSLALSGLSGMWFAVKEAAFPSLVGIFVLYSARTRKPFMEMILKNPQIMHLDKLESSLREKSADQDFHHLLVRGTLWFSASFFISAVCNFLIALRVFTPIDPNLALADQQAILNQQIASMTGQAALVIMLPSMLFMMGLMFYLFRRLEKITGEPWQNFMKS